MTNTQLTLLTALDLSDLVEMVIHIQSPCSEIRMSTCSSQYRGAGRVKNKEI